MKIERIEKSIDVDVPVRTAYNQWTQFESFPQFMEGVDQVEQTDDTHLHWVATIAGQHKEWDAEIIEQERDKLISWRSTSGPVNSGSVSFDSIAGEPDRCKLTVIMTYGLEEWKEKVGDALGFFSARVAGDLKRFKDFIEERKVATGAWRGEVHAGHVTRKPGETVEGGLWEANRRHL